jgi:PAS domain-containing protein
MSSFDREQLLHERASDITKLFLLEAHKEALVRRPLHLVQQVRARRTRKASRRRAREHQRERTRAGCQKCGESAAGAREDPGGAWIRDLTEEGVEPHPGPGLVCQNIDGVSSISASQSASENFRLLILSILRLHKKEPILAACVQEHHLKRTKIDEIDAEAEAFRLGVLLIINPMPSDAYKGGTAIAIPLDAIELKKDETRDPAVDRIRQSAHLSTDGRLTTADIILNGASHRVASKKLMNIPARAFLRHVIGVYYRDATRVHENGATFLWERTFHHALKQFRDAVLRRGHAMRRLFVHRRFTNLTGIVAEVDREKYDKLVTIDQSGTSQLKPAFENAIAKAEKAANTRAQAQQINPTGRNARRAQAFRGIAQGGGPPRQGPGRP